MSVKTERKSHQSCKSQNTSSCEGSPSPHDENSACWTTPTLALTPRRARTRTRTSASQGGELFNLALKIAKKSTYFNSGATAMYIANVSNEALLLPPLLEDGEEIDENLSFKINYLCMRCWQKGTCGDDYDAVLRNIPKLLSSCNNVEDTTTTNKILPDEALMPLEEKLDEKTSFILRPKCLEKDPYPYDKNDAVCTDFMKTTMTCNNWKDFNITIPKTALHEPPLKKEITTERIDFNL